MSEFVKKPLQAKMNRKNILSRVESLEKTTGAKPSAVAGNLASITPDAGDLSAGTYFVYDQTTGSLRGYLTAAPKPEFPGYYMVFLDSSGMFQWGVNADDGSATWGAGSGTLSQEGLIISDAGDAFIIEDTVYGPTKSVTSFVPNTDNTSYYRNMIYVPNGVNNLINGDFETGDFSNWTETDPSNKVSVVAGAGPDGSYAAYFQSTTDTAKINQSVLGPATYGVIVSFDAKNTTSSSTYVVVSNGAETKNVIANTDWRKYYTYLTTSTTDISFQTSGAADVYLDNISVIPLNSSTDSTNSALSYFETNSSTMNIRAGGVLNLYAGQSSSTDLSQITLDAKGNLTQNTYFIRSIIRKANISDNVATSLFTITTTNETGSNDAGTYSCLIKLNVCHGDNIATGAVAEKFGMYSFSRAMEGTGTGVNTAVNVITTGASAATTSATRDIGTITVTVTETSEYIMTVNVQVDLTGSAVATATVIADVELLYTTFTTPPIVAVA